MKLTPKKIIVSLAVVGALLFVGGGSYIWWLMQRPLFQPGSVAQRTDLTPVAIEEDYWQVTPDIRLKTFSTGQGRNVLFLHGGPGIPIKQSAPAFDQLAQGYKVHYFDQRGSGQSTRPFDRFPLDNGAWQNIQQLEGTLGLAQQLADIERIRQLLGDEKLILIGHSYGALLATLYAAEFPDNVEKLVLITPADLLVFPSGNGDFFTNIKAHVPERDHKAYDKWLRRYLDLAQVFKEGEAALQALDAELAPYFVTTMGDNARFLPPLPIDQIGSWHTRAQFFSMGKRHDWRDQAAQITAPTLILHASEDVFGIEVPQTYQAAIPGSQLQVIEGASHFPHFSKPEDVASKVGAFLSAP